MTVGERIKQRRKALNMSAEELAEVIGKSPATVYRYEKGDIRRVDSTSLQPIADALKTTPGYLMGWEDAPRADAVGRLPDNLIPVSSMRPQRVPLIGRVAAGEPILAEEDYETLVCAPVKCDYALRIEGESMKPIFEDGDVVYIRRQSDVRDGQIAVVLLDDSATIKYVYHDRDGLTLISENRAYPRIIAHSDEYSCISILGVPVGFTRMFSVAADPLSRVHKGFPEK